MSSVKYRPEIDGLRAIAILSVLFFHAQFSIGNINLFAGGFIGVDIFFVISGYLIAKILFFELNDSKFEFLKFYERRARRILPALFFIILSTIPLSYLYLLPKAMKEYSISLLATLLFSSNFWFWKEDSYWAEPSSLKPFLHTWSLSVEEQFYLFFPVFLLFVWKFAKKHINSFFIFIFLFSLFLAHYLSGKFESAAFYLLPTREWELLAGVLLAKFELERPINSYGMINSFMPKLGLFLVINSVIFFHEGIRHPSILTLIPILGTSLIIRYSKEGEIVTQILSSKLATGIGLISYSLYLWHVPIFAFLKIKEPNFSQIELLILVFLIFGLSIGTYNYVEKPFRNKHIVKTKQFYIIIISLFSIIAFTQLYFFRTDGAAFRFKPFYKLVDIDYWSDKKNYRKKFFTHDGCWLGEQTITPGEPFKICKSLEKLNTKSRVMLIGDSNVASLVPGLIKYLGRDRIVERVANGCIPSKNFERDFCRQAINAGLNEIHSIKPNLIILGGYYVKHQDLLDMGKLLENELKSYRDKIIVLGPLPRWHDDGLPSKLLKSYNLNPLQPKLPFRLEASPDSFELDNDLRKLSLKWQVSYLSPVKTFCKNRLCLVRLGNKPWEITSWDIVHFTHSASNFLVEKNLFLINKFLKEDKQN